MIKDILSDINNLDFFGKFMLVLDVIMFIVIIMFLIFMIGF